MGFILVNLHGGRCNSVSNQMQKSRAMGPDYAVQWWKKRDMLPPEIDPYEYFFQRICWRYRHGIIDNSCPAEIIRGDARQVLSNRLKGFGKESEKERFDFLFTSPPYFNVTDYRQDNWIRLWMLDKGPSLPDWKKDTAIVKEEFYRQMLYDVFLKASELLKSHSVIWIRTDARSFTKDTTLQIIRTLWAGRKLFMRYDRPERLTQTAHYGNRTSKPGEVDFLIPGKMSLPGTISSWKKI